MPVGARHNTLVGRDEPRFQDFLTHCVRHIFGKVMPLVPNILENPIIMLSAIPKYS